MPTLLGSGKGSFLGLQTAVLQLYPQHGAERERERIAVGGEGVRSQVVARAACGANARASGRSNLVTWWL